MLSRSVTPGIAARSGCCSLPVFLAFWIGCEPLHRRTGVAMRLKMARTALMLISMLSGCGGGIAAQSNPFDLGSSNEPALAPKGHPPFAYVAQTCRTSASCPSPNGLVQMLGGPAITSGVENPTTLALDGSGDLYVGDSTSSNQGDVSVYAPKSVTPLRTLSGITGVPKGLVADAAGRLFVVAQYRSGCCELEGTGEIYAPGGTQPVHPLKGLSGFAHSPVLDNLGNLYVANFDVFPGWVSVYERGRRAPSRLINDGIGLPIGLALTPKGELVVLNGLFSGGYNVTLYPAGGSAPSLTITAALHASTSVAVDADGNVYVANGRERKQRGSITVYRNGQTTVWRSIHSGITFPTALAFDGSGRLYVAEVPRKGASSVAIFAPGGSKPLRTYRLTEQFSALAVPH